MYNQTYSSSIISLRTSFSLNEYSYYSNERCPASYCSCCCSDLSRFIVPIINPSFSYGLRQSTLIQCPPSRRLIFGSRLGVSDVGLCCNGEFSCVKRDSVDKEKCCYKKMSVNKQQLFPKYVLPSRSVGISRYNNHAVANAGFDISVNVNVNVNKIRDRVARSNYRCNALGDAEAILSLLTEEPIEQLLDARGRRSRSSKDGGVCVDSRGRKENLQSGYLGGQSGRHRVELAEMKSKEEVKRREEREVRSKDEERRSRRKESRTGASGSRLDTSREEDRWSRRNESGSSYYSGSDTSDLVSDTEAGIRDERLAKPSSVRHGKDSKQTGRFKEEERRELGRFRDERDQHTQWNARDDDFRHGSFDKSENIVLSDKVKSELERNRDARNHEQLQSNKDDGIRVGSVTEWDWRNKSEKRLTEESAEETRSRKESVVGHSHMSQTRKDSSITASRPEKQFNYQEEGSTPGASFHGQFRSRIEKDNQLSESSKSSVIYEQSTQTAGHGVEATSDIQERLNQGEEGIVAVGQSIQETGCKYCETCRRIIQENTTQTGFQQLTEVSEIRDDARWTSTAQSQSESRLGKQEKSSTSLQTSSQEENYLFEQMRTQQNSITVDSHGNYAEGTSSLLQQSDAHMKTLEENSSLLIATQEVKGSQNTSGRKVSLENEPSRVAQTGLSASQVYSTKAEINRQSASEQHYGEAVYAIDNYAEDSSSSRQQTDTHTNILQEISSSAISPGVKRLQEKSGLEVIEEIESTTVGQSGTSASQIHSTNAEISHWSASKQSIYDEHIYSTKVKVEEVLIDKHKHIDETNVQSSIRTEVQRPIAEVTYTGNVSGEATVSQPSIALISQIEVQQISGTEGGASIMRNDSGGITQVEAASVYINPQARIPSSFTGVSSEIESYEDPSHGDSMGSAERMEESSVQIVGGFIEDMRHVASTQDSQLQVETSSLHTPPQARTPPSNELIGGRSEPYKEFSHEYALVSAELMEKSSVQIVSEFVEKMQHEASTSQSTHQDEQYMLKESTQSDSEKPMFQKQESRRSSGSSDTKEPSDDMWDAKDHFAQESSERDSSKRTASENVTVRTGKSLWNILAGVLRLQSGSNAKTQKSSAKSSGHSSPNESGSGDARSSEDEVDEGNAKIVKTKDTNLPQEPSPRNRREDLGMMISDDRMSYVEVGASSSSSVLQTGSLSAGPSYGANPIFNVTLETPQSSPLDLTVSPARRLTRSHEFKETEESGSSKTLGEQSVDVGQSGLEIASEATDVESKQSKLQRSNQVLHERYDEWEDAYRREREQREVDENFMREALEEAEKAADSWEVPVGAVLVLNGKVIARGYNLVEELRDSTAHAEMMCIREASNILQTWRLSETTMYVTLEPCPMCAGAILQARVGTLVWGAPNKLLGADGSWIRLFRDGLAGEEERPETADKPVAPVHPFHTNMKIRRGVLEPECADIMQQFFQLRRRKEKSSKEPTQAPKLSNKIFKFPLIHKKRSS